VIKSDVFTSYNTKMKQIHCPLFFIGMLLFPSCTNLPKVENTAAKTYDGLVQVVAYAPWLFSGSKPIREDGFASLQSLHVRTIVCVDGTPPELNIPEQIGIKTYHIPIKYGKLTSQQVFDIVTAVEIGRRRGNTYIHCHHGKHRSAVAAAISLISLGESTPEKMMPRMLVSETSALYSGLLESVREAVVLDSRCYVENEKNIPSSVLPVGITEQMIALEFALENLLHIEKSNWLPPTFHPDLVPAAEAGALAESFRALNSSELAKKFPSDFAEQLFAAWSAASTLENLFVTNTATQAQLSEALNTVKNSCTACHRSYRK
jgi:hypothetical protein